MEEKMSWCVFCSYQKTGLYNQKGKTGTKLQAYGKVDQELCLYEQKIQPLTKFRGEYNWVHSAAHTMQICIGTWSFFPGNFANHNTPPHL